MKTFNLQDYLSAGKLVKTRDYKTGGSKLVERNSIYHGIPIEYLSTVQAIMRKYKKSDPDYAGKRVMYNFRGHRTVGLEMPRDSFTGKPYKRGKATCQSNCVKREATTFAVYCRDIPHDWRKEEAKRKLTKIAELKAQLRELETA